MILEQTNIHGISYHIIALLFWIKTFVYWLPVLVNLAKSEDPEEMLKKQHFICVITIHLDKTELLYILTL